MSIGKQLKQLRTARKKTLIEVGNTVGVSKQSLYKYERGIVTNIPPNIIAALAKYYDVTPSYLFEWQEDPMERPDNYISIGPGIRFFREEEEYSLDAFAKELGISANKLSDIESDVVYPPESLMFEICHKLNISYLEITEFPYRREKPTSYERFTLKLKTIGYLLQHVGINCYILTSKGKIKISDEEIDSINDDAEKYLEFLINKLIEKEPDRFVANYKKGMSDCEKPAG